MATSDRPLLVGDPSGPAPPYPLRMSGPVIAGFGRGSKELGIPTANLPVDGAAATATAPSWIADIPSGVYFGWASLRLPPSHPDYVPPASSDTTTTDTATAQQPQGQGQGKNEKGEEGQGRREEGAAGEGRYQVYPMVMSIGYNPFYKNTVRSAEVHVLHRFGADFYGADMRLLILGYIRPERDYAGLDALVADIEFDCEVARRSLLREGWAPREVEVEISGIGTVAGAEGAAGAGGETRRVRGTLDAGWLIRPSEEEGK